ncbi:hypothetical protein [Hungatella sp.]|uniref:hypothetical protein n=1 Tax=Hungatella sp. TaxID=2613924 RepID=UPI0039915621
MDFARSPFAPLDHTVFFQSFICFSQRQFLFCKPFPLGIRHLNGRTQISHLNGLYNVSGYSDPARLLQKIFIRKSGADHDTSRKVLADDRLRCRHPVKSQAFQDPKGLRPDFSSGRVPPHQNRPRLPLSLHNLTYCAISNKTFKNL